MPLPFAHALVGASLAAAIHTRPGTTRYRVALVSGAILANAPDLDFFLVFTLHSKAWHRGFTHSLVFAGFVCLLFVLTLGTRRLRDALAYGAAFASHGLLDFLTTKIGGGVELFWPFSAERLLLGRAGLSEMPSLLPPLTILRWLLVELAIFAPLLLAVLFWRRSHARRAGSPARAE
ncbi:MAG TPA: metal-dependent hydrolase [Pyrinomonadaceae bacterium]